MPAAAHLSMLGSEHLSTFASSFRFAFTSSPPV
jgi:hypothetical protein